MIRALPLILAQSDVVQDLVVLVPAMRGTIIVTTLAFVLAVVGGYAQFVLARIPVPPIARLVVVYGRVIRGIPPLVWIFVAFFGLQSMGIVLSPMQAGVGALGLVGASYVSEYFRGGFQAVSKGQREAALALGMSSAIAIYFVVLPQALRATIPPVANYLISLLKDTSFVSIIGVGELTHAAYVRVQQTFAGPRIYLVAAALYLCLSYPLSILARRVERRLTLGFQRVR